jgi:hypothetical protein
MILVAARLPRPSFGRHAPRRPDGAGWQSTRGVEKDNNLNGRPSRRWEAGVENVSTRVLRIGLVAILACAALLRAMPLLTPNGAQASADFDEGVYLSAAGLLSEGHMPYRDFVLLHPPGLLLTLWPLTSLAPELLDWSSVLVAARWLAVVVGVVNVGLLMAVTARWQGRAAGLVAAVLYAAYPSAVSVEGHALLEPFVVLFVLLAARVWLTPESLHPGRRGGAAGILFAFAGLIKLTGGLAFLGLLVSPPHKGDRTGRLWAVATASATVVVVLAPFVAVSGVDRIWQQVILAQIERPGGDLQGGSVLGLHDRLAQTGRLGAFSADAVPAAFGLGAILLVAGVAAWAWVRGGRDGRFWVGCLAGLLLPPLFAPDWYAQYPAPAAVPMCALLGAASVRALSLLRKHRPVVARVGTAALVLFLAAGVVDAFRDAVRNRLDGAPGFAAYMSVEIPAGECLVAEPPDLGLAIDLLPVRDRSGTYLVDPFGALLESSLREGETGTTPELITAPAAQARLRSALSSCRFVALRAEPAHNARMSTDTAAWFEEQFRKVPTAITPHATLWERVG